MVAQGGRLWGATDLLNLYLPNLEDMTVDWGPGMEELLPCSDQAAHVCVLSTCWLSDYRSCAGLAANPSLPELSQTSHPDFLTSSQTAASRFGPWIAHHDLHQHWAWAVYLCYLCWSWWLLCPRVAGSGKNYEFAADFAWKIGCSFCKGREEPKSAPGNRRVSVLGSKLYQRLISDSRSAGTDQ